MEKVLESFEDLQEEAESFAKTLSPDEKTATLIALSGELGAGKTSFTQGLARSLGIIGAVTSPTFVLQKVYPLTKKDGQGFSQLVHIDAYRLESEVDLARIDFEECMSDPKTLILFEWPEKIQNLRERANCEVSITVLPDMTRKITYTKHEND
jgi:tRNA threonylcarbamoyladenosine biosynthesis protein TsaE